MAFTTRGVVGGMGVVSKRTIRPGRERFELNLGFNMGLGFRVNGLGLRILGLCLPVLGVS